VTEPDATVEMAVEPIDNERQRRWRLLLGEPAASARSTGCG